MKQLYFGIAPGPAVELYLVPGGCVGLVGVEDGRVHCSATAALPAFRQAGGGVGRFLAWALRRNPALARRLAAGRPVGGTEITIANVGAVVPPRPRDGVSPMGGGTVAVSLVPGDSAAAIPPFLDDGTARALRSAELLLPLLERRLSGELSAADLAAVHAAQWARESAGRMRPDLWLRTGLLWPAGADMLLAVGRQFPGWVRRLLPVTRTPAAPAPPGPPVPPITPLPPVPPTPVQATRRERM